MSTLVTGSAGFLGRRVMSALAALGETAVGFDRQLPASPTPGEFVCGDLFSPGALAAALALHGARRIIHLAAMLPPDTEQEPGEGARVNVFGTRLALEEAARHGVERFVYASSIAVYGPQSWFGERPVNEDDVPCPQTCYGLAKAASEAAALALGSQRGFDVRVLRISSVFGHGRFKGASGAIGGRLISQPATGGPVAVEARSDAACSLIYVDDAAELCARLALESGLNHRLYNSGGITATVHELAEVVRSLVPGADIRTGDTPIPHVHRVDGSRLAADLGFAMPPLRLRVAHQIAEARLDRAAVAQPETRR